MSAKRFLIYRLASVVILALIISSSITMGNYLLPIVAMITFLILLYALKKKVKEVLEDERDYEIAGKASRYSISVFGLIAGVTIIVLFALRASHPLYETIGQTLAYSVCALLIVYSLIFKYFQRMSK